MCLSQLSKAQKQISDDWKKRRGLQRGGRGMLLGSWWGHRQVVQWTNGMQVSLEGAPLRQPSAHFEVR